MCTFAGASSLPIVVAEQRDIFAAEGLRVELHTTRSSKELMDGLLMGEFEIVHAAPDNFVAWRDRTGEPIVAWIGGTSGPLKLVGRPDCSVVSDLRGKVIAVDAPDSGFVSVLRKMLRAAGVDETEMHLEALGATRLRFEALRAGRVAATMLTLPWSAMAEADGFNVLSDQRAVVPRLQGSCGASLQGWLDKQPAAADAYLRSIVTALTWSYLPESSARIRALLAERYEIVPAHAELVRAAILDPVAGWPPSALIDPLGMESVCTLRTENGTPPRESPGAYYSLEPYERVMGFGHLAT